VAGTSYGAPGIAATSVTVMALYTAAVGAWWHRSNPMPPLTATILRSAVAAAVAGAAGWLVARALPGDAVASVGAALVAAAVGGATVTTAFIAVLRLAGETIRLRR
jgi:hypothetical protein